LRDTENKDRNPDRDIKKLIIKMSNPMVLETLLDYKRKKIPLIYLWNKQVLYLTKRQENFKKREETNFLTTTVRSRKRLSLE
jgi:hypothetical protein